LVGGATKLSKFEVLNGEGVFEGGNLCGELKVFLEVVVELDVIERVSGPERIIIKFSILEFILNGCQVPFWSTHLHVMIKPSDCLVVRNGHVVELGQVPQDLPLPF
jgi:hypothetical protein